MTVIIKHPSRTLIVLHLNEGKSFFQIYFCDLATPFKQVPDVGLLKVVGQIADIECVSDFTS